MIRRIALVRRCRDLRPDAFRRHWLEVHAPLARGLPGLRCYRVNPIVEAPPDLGWDGVGELWFDSIDAALTAFAEEPLSGLVREDLARFAADSRAFFVEEHIIVSSVEEGI